MDTGAGLVRATDLPGEVVDSSVPDLEMPVEEDGNSQPAPMKPEEAAGSSEACWIWEAESPVTSAKLWEEEDSFATALAMVVVAGDSSHCGRAAEVGREELGGRTWSGPREAIAGVEGTSAGHGLLQSQR